MEKGKKTSLCLGATMLLGTCALVTFSKKIKEKAHSEITRYKAKKIINDKLGSNERLLNMVDDLSDTELMFMDQVIREIRASRH